MPRILVDISRTVLLVEPDENMRAIMTMAMEAFDCIVVSARTLAAAEAILADRRVGAIVSNSVLPDGMADALAERDVPCVFMSPDAEAAGRAEARGMMCLTMPFPMARLMRMLRAPAGAKAKKTILARHSG